MLSTSYLAGLSDGLVELYSQLEADIISDMAKRLKRLGKVTDKTLWQAKIFQEAGGLQQDINKWVEKYDKQAEKQLKELFKEALEKSAAKDVAQLNKAGLSDSQEQIMNATVKKVASAGIVSGSKKVREDAEQGFIKMFSSVQRATMTIASSASNDFVLQANAAYMKVVSGAFDYDTALIQGLIDLANKGVHTVEYGDSGKPFKRSVEGMLRTNIMTGINQTATRVTLDNCSDLDCELVEVSAHMGARPEHEAWQGKIYSLNPDNKKYPYFYTVCGYGEPDGICGINCRHSFYPYFEDVEPMYSKGELDEYKDATVTYTTKDKDGKETKHTITQYEGEQKQRYMERQIRKYKRQISGLEQLAPDSPECLAARNKLYQWQKANRDFTEQTGLRRDYAREFIGTKDGKQPRGILNTKESTGGILEKSEKEQDKFAHSYYEEIRNRKVPSDINRISKNTGFPKEKVEAVRNHVFFNEHSFYDGRYERFKPDVETALAWQRLERGEGSKLDRMLLNHEYTELTFMLKKGYVYEVAHLYANVRYPWEYKKNLEKEYTDGEIRAIIKQLFKMYL